MRAFRTMLVLSATLSAALVSIAKATEEPSVLVVAHADQLALVQPAGLARPIRAAGIRGQQVQMRAAPAQAALAAHHADRVRLLGGVARSKSDVRFLQIDSTEPGFDARATARDLKATGLFDAVIMNQDLKLSVTTPNDSFYGAQWALQAAASETPHLPEAWDLARGDTSVVIGIIDTGVDIGHPDLKTQIFHNPHEIPGNGIDDDGNGFVDDVNGWDFGNEDNDPRPAAAIDSASGFDIAIHGTHVAGIAAAATDNGEGVASAGWRCRIMPLKIMNAAGHMTEAKAAEAILYAADNGASIINMSFAAAPDSSSPGQEAAFFQALINQAIAANIVPVAAAGNEGVSDLRYPAACDSVLAVAATNEFQTMSYYTNWGYWVDLNAPGDDIASTLPTNYTFDPTTLFYLEYVYGYDGVNPYCNQTGTSMACPLVAGVAGLVRGKYPQLTAVQVMDHLKATGDDEPYDKPIGMKLNAYNAVLAAPTGVGPTPPPTLGEIALAALPSPFHETTSIRFVVPVAGDVSLVVYDASGRVVRTLAHGWKNAGPQAVTWNGLDRAGREVPTGIYFAALAAPGSSQRIRVLRLR
jgi:subtilisin family serine protease